MDQTHDKRRFWLVRKKTVYIVLGSLLFINAPIFIWLFSEMHASAEAVDGFGQRLIAKDYDGAYNRQAMIFEARLASRNSLNSRRR